MPRPFRLFLAVVVVAACGGERLPVSSARPTGTRWFCAHGNWVACGRTAETCPEENRRVGTRIVNPGDLPKPEQCQEQELATCYTYFDPTVRKTLYDCFVDRIECEGYLKEAERSPAQHQDLSSCGTWD
jgi:hypothetical protein